MWPASERGRRGSRGGKEGSGDSGDSDDESDSNDENSDSLDSDNAEDADSESGSAPNSGSDSVSFVLQYSYFVESFKRQYDAFWFCNKVLRRNCTLTFYTMYYVRVQYILCQRSSCPPGRCTFNGLCFLFQNSESGSISSYDSDSDSGSSSCKSSSSSKSEGSSHSPSPRQPKQFSVRETDKVCVSFFLFFFCVKPRKYFS